MRGRWARKGAFGDRRAATARLGGAEVAHEHRKVGLDPGDAGPKTCLAQPTQLLASRARFVVFLIDGYHSVGRIFGDDDVTDNDASAGHNDARDAAEQISLARPIEVVNRECRDHQIEWSLWKGIFEPSRAQLRGEKCSTGAVEHGRTFVDAHQLCAWVLSQHSLRGDSCSHTQVQNRPCTQTACHLGHDILEAVVGGHLAPDELEIGLRMEVKLVAHAFRPYLGPKSSQPSRSVRGGQRPGDVRCERSVRRDRARISSSVAARGGSQDPEPSGQASCRVSYWHNRVVAETSPPDDVLRAAGLEESLIERVGRGSRVWIATTSNGSVVLRRCRYDAPRWLHPILSALATRFPVPMPLGMFGGRSFLDHPSGVWEVVSLLPGRAVGVEARPALDEIGAFCGVS